MAERTQLFSQLRQALAHLDDPLYLESLDLARQISLVAQSAGLSRGQNLRRALHLAITALDPSQCPAVDAVEPRSYQVLCRYAIAKQSMLTIARQLDISQRQGYRDLYQAIEALAQILRDLEPHTEVESSGPPNPAASRAAKVRTELERLAGTDEQDVDLSGLLAGVVESVRLLAQERQITVQLSDETAGLRVATNRVMLRQAILNLLSHMVSIHQGECVLVKLQASVEDARVQLCYRPEATPNLAQSESPYAVAVQLLNTLDLRWSRSEQPGGSTQVVLDIPLVRQHTVLVVDDNEGVIALFARYLRHRPFHLVGARNFQEALGRLAEVQPDVIILDIMLPNQDGWEVLQALRAHLVGKQPRIIMCSIINDPKLARALGADAFLHKPVRRQDLLQALELVLLSTK